ncbi:MAG: DUF2341 domain-containing protein [Candidatus Dojkabacteria bacterium]|nr:MAG: DUF2341 domain-containing protein [Candidatus Dojkabacteria bacterium]
MKLKKFFLKVLYSRLLVICLSVLILFVPIIVILVNPDATSASTWFDDSWAYRREVDISGNTALLTNFQVKITAVNTQTLFNEGKLQFNCQDIRFVDRAGNLLPYWIVDKDLACGDSTSTDFWVRMPRVEVGGTKIYMYYGNQLANAYSSGANTFNFFSDLSIQQAPWYNSAWGLRQKFTIAKEMVRASTLTDFPVYLDLSLLGTEFFDRVDADGDDIVITAADGVTKLNRELVSLNTSTDTGKLWFLAPTLSATDDNHFYIYYANSSASETNSTAVWSGSYRLVQHMNQDPSGSAPQLLDSSGSANNATMSGSMLSSASVEGIVGNGIDFDGTNDYFAIDGSATLDLQQLSISAWVKLDDTTKNMLIFEKSATNAVNTQYSCFIEGSNQLILFRTVNASSVLHSQSFSIAGGVLKPGVWTHIACVYNGSSKNIYINGNLVDTTAYSQTLRTNPTGASRIGAHLSNGYYFDGVMDEVRVASTGLSRGWINTEIENQKSLNKYIKVESSENHKSSDKTISGFELNGNIQINNNGTITLSDASNTIGLVSNSTFATSSRVLFRASQSSNTLDIARLGFSNRTFANNFNADDSAYFSFTSASGNWIRNTSNEGTTTTTAGSIAENTVARVFEIAWRTGNTDFIVDNTSAGALTTNVPDENMYLRFETSNTSDSVVLDWIAVGQHATSIPTTVVVGSEVKSEGPLLWLKLDETEGQILKNHGTAGSKLDGYLGTAPYVTTSDPLRVNQCVSGNCLKLDGVNDIFQVDHHDLLNMGTGDFTVSMWILANDQQGGATNYATLFIKTSNPSTPYQGMTAFIDTPFVSPVGKTIFRVSNANELETNASALDDSRWRHYVFMRESNVLKIFINGVLDNSLAISSLDINNTAPLRFGSNHLSVTSQNYDGFMDEIKLYDRAITTDEVLKEYNSYSQVLGTSNNEDRSGLLAWWKFDEGLWNGTANQVIDASGNNFHGTATGGAVVTGNSIYGNSGSFDGTNDYVNFNHNALNFGANDSFTVSAWVKANNPTSGTIRTAVQRYNTGTTYPYVLKLHSDNTWQFAIWDGSNNPTASSSNNVNSDWHHLVGVRDKAKGTLSLYLDGVLVSEVADTTTGSISNAASTKVGIQTTTNIAPWNGLIDDVRIYRTALDKKAVEDLYSFQPDAIAHWKLDEKEGTTANDSSLNNLHGTLQNMSGNEWQEGKISKSLRFDGTNDYISVPDNDLLDVAAGGSFSIATWFKTDGTVSSDSLLVGKGGLGNSIGYSLYLDSTGKVVCGIDDDAISFPEDSVVSTAEYDDSEWHHALCVKRNTKLQLFVNGQRAGPDDTTLSSTGALYNNSSLFIGGSDIGNEFSGQIDDIRFFNYAVSSFSKIADFDYIFSSINEDLLRHYKFEEQSYSNITGEVMDTSKTFNGTGVSGATTSSTSIVGNRSVSLNGTTSYVNAGSFNSTLKSFSIWINPTTTANDRRIFGALSGSTSNFALAFFSNKINAWTGASWVEISNSTIPTNQWSHIVILLGNSNTKLYINGVLDKTTTTTFSNFATTFGIGNKYLNSWGFNFSGYIDDFRAYSKILTDDEIISLNDLKDIPESTDFLNLTQSTEKQTTQDLAVHYKLDSKSGVTAVDSSTNAANGTLNNTTDANWVRGKVGGAINLNGSDQYVSTADSSLFDWSNQITVSAWFKTSTAAQRSLVAKMAGANAYEFHLSVEADGRVRCWMSTNGTTPSTLAYSLTGQNYVNGEWNFATCVYNGSNIRVTVNGLPGTAVNFTGNIHNGAQPLTIGGNPSWGGSWMFNGSIDNVKIWKRALTVREIALEYNGGAPTGYWKFDEGSGTTAFDHSGNGLHATLLNTTPSTAWLAPTNCKYNGCHEFDGTNDYATTSTSAYLNPPQELTLSTWVKFTKTYVGAGNDLIFGKDFTSHTDPFYHYRLSSVGNYGPDPYRLGFFVKTSTVTVNRSCGTGANYWNSRVGEWMHLVGTYDAQGTLKFYIDGQLICSHTGGGLIANYNTGLNFARYRNVNIYVPVVLDETKHFTYALTEEDVKREYYSNGASLLFK